MADLANCSKCGRLYIQNLHGICDVCRKEEDKLFDTVYQYIRKRENRTATTAQITKDTGVPEEVIMRFVKEGRIRTTQFPNLGYRCERCGTLIKKGKICDDCTNSIQSDLRLHDLEEENKRKRLADEKKAHTYYSLDAKLNKNGEK
ncbi:TIGR03826 family flagellar region protein [Bacillus sp. Marseille-P3661]|uniref:TIGR03826 family flagellar region protein n=1 Tax=Bacillus sp. Marseille-P3661 TaxID=1936234 RepID=UPI000C845D3E|nr:TIGR03826 family flagellar region protein [Bacillus sp. Marseille-P3661]